MALQGELELPFLVSVMLLNIGIFVSFGVLGVGLWVFIQAVPNPVVEFPMFPLVVVPHKYTVPTTAVFQVAAVGLVDVSRFQPHGKTQAPNRGFNKQLGGVVGLAKGPGILLVVNLPKAVL